MAVPRASSPASRVGSPGPLTPRSKIRALLATVESSDDEESQTGNKKPKSSLISQLPRKMCSSPRRAQDDESDESDVAIRPRGKLASRMQGGGAAATESASRSPATAESARDRVRRMLQREEAEKQGNSATGDDEDDDLPTAPRRLTRRAPVDDESDADAAETAPRPNSPGLFVSSPMRPSPAKSAAAGDDSDNDLPPLKSERFKALVERKRQERLAREAAEEAVRAERRAQQEHLASELEQLVSDEDVDGITDDEGGRRLTQEARPSRKASRKAIEEMNRETQRMARSMQLAHDAKTRKKISKASLFERFSYKPVGWSEVRLPGANSSSRPTTPQSDVEMGEAFTPPSSPPLDKQHDQLVNENAAVPKEGMEAAAQGRVDREISLIPASVEAGQQSKPKRRVRVRLPVAPMNAAVIDADGDLQITTSAKDKIDALFANIPSKKSGEAQSLQIFRALAQVKSPGKESRGRKDQSKMSPGELQAYLQLKARQQAKLERDRRLEILKGQGIIIQTAEERERQEQEVEDIVAKARQEAQKIMEEERGEAKRQQKKNGQVDPLAWDDSDDEENQVAAQGVDAEASEVEISGSEDEDEDEAEADNAEEVERAANPLFDEEADSSVSEAETSVQSEDGADEMEQPGPRQRRARNMATVLSDDESEVEATPKPVKVTTTQMTPAGAGTISPFAPGSVLRSARKTFIPGLPVQGPAGLGLTQIFAGTMDSQVSYSEGGPTQSMMPDFDHFPDSNFSATMDEPAEETTVDSQQEETQGVQLNLSQSQMHGLGTLIADGMQTQTSEMLELSQDAGLQQLSPLRDRFIEPPFSTVDTVMVEKQNEDTAQESPIVRRGRLRRRMDMSVAETAIPETSEPRTPGAQGNAFQAMRDAARKEKRLRVAEDFDRRKSKAKEMVEEQAEESEDEYAGLGGVDGEDSDHDSDGSVAEMIDDAAGNDNDERKLAAFYADRERANDEQQVEKLFRDITTGMLRRKRRGGDFDLSDSDSDGEARRRMKRRQFAKMQKALFADERVKKIAENPGNQAFLRSMEDRGSDDEMDLLDAPDTPDSESHNETQEQARRPATVIPDSQPVQQQPPSPTANNTRAPARMRRTKNAKRPSNIGDVRETLSNLLEEPHGSMVPATEVGSDGEEEEEGQDDDGDSSRGDKEDQPVVDRIALKRTLSCAGSTVRMAFTTQTRSSFKVPALLRRATTNSTLVSGSAGGSAPSGGAGFGDDAKIKKAAGKKSGIGGFARRTEHSARVQETERRRQERRVEGARGRLGMVGGILGKGTFE
ncbi:DNA replication checkpoint mediator, MRC1 domain protein [Metarhizium album ARSEF 1941]|uniref:DNA replication checkpoint mediator, MRC1 domain protein n=1 Tax=Metarhizium album (strain ARSEF 1941) TaxID=1081103 RepID=A0A0B2WTI1_METAS|nr:DNA replication checkpoint mediator, MRC1 domain protein [Metarhizium album ARSEF 1941]KHN99386.1 DNA replication checkpoint mediator, MRC1 domain protein [Metarhizium album ARSEF 1941]